MCVASPTPLLPLARSHAVVPSQVHVHDGVIVGEAKACHASAILQRVQHFANVGYCFRAEVEGEVGRVVGRQVEGEDVEGR